MMTAKFRKPNESDGIGARLMRKTSSFLVLAVLLALAAASTASPGAGTAALAASQGTDLWGGPGAKGTGSQGARFDTIVYVTGTAAATGAVEFWSGGSIVATETFAIPANGVATIPAPAALDGKGAFALHVRSDAGVTAWSQTYNETDGGRFGVSLTAAAPGELLAPGDEATGGGADASSSTDPGKARTNVGVVCVSSATQACRVEVAAFASGALVGTGTVESIPGGANQSSLEALVPASAGKSGLGLRLRFLSGSGFPYAIRNDNRTSDGTAIPLAVKKGAFSTAPVIVSFSASPATGCAPLATTFSWQTTGASKVSISGVAGDLPPNGTYATTVSTGGEYVLTATSLTGQSSTQALQMTITPSTPKPTPVPASATVPTGGVVTGIFPAGTGPVTVEFVKHESSGSTFTVQGTAWVYAAGTTPGTDVVRITAAGGSCGAASADFTARVVLPGEPIVVRAESIPARGCAPSTNILLTWQTENAKGVAVSGFDEMFVANGGVETTVTSTTIFTITAMGFDGAMDSAVVAVPVDPQLYVPILNPGAAQVDAGTLVVIDVDPNSVPDVGGVRWTILQNQSGFTFAPDANVPGRFRYRSGSYTGVDRIRFLWVNGCGIGYTDFTSNVSGRTPQP
jgi:hypothetical protein